mmetsp:Transcript_37439/g.86512  ORF Transcript_37439/g.86512 Transcript_37439/m.86512 type:complete len:242 (+) Transcript_37439:112-837(+)
MRIDAGHRTVQQETLVDDGGARNNLTRHASPLDLRHQLLAIERVRVLDGEGQGCEKNVHDAAGGCSGRGADPEGHDRRDRGPGHADGLDQTVGALHRRNGCSGREEVGEDADHQRLRHGDNEEDEGDAVEANVCLKVFVAGLRPESVGVVSQVADRACTEVEVDHQVEATLPAIGRERLMRVKDQRHEREEKAPAEDQRQLCACRCRAHEAVQVGRRHRHLDHPERRLEQLLGRGEHGEPL